MYLRCLVQVGISRNSPCSLTENFQIFPKFHAILKTHFYSAPVLSITNSLILSERLADPDLLREATALITVAVRSQTVRETELEMLAILNHSHKKALNVLLDSLSPGVAKEVFGHIAAFESEAKHQEFAHKCLEWGDHPPAKKIRVEDNPRPSPAQSTKKRLNHATRGLKSPGPIKSECDPKCADDDSSATEVIQRLKGEVKGLLKIGKTEKLTAKNCTDLRILISQLSSLM